MNKVYMQFQIESVVCYFNGKNFGVYEMIVSRAFWGFRRTYHRETARIIQLQGTIRRVACCMERLESGHRTFYQWIRTAPPHFA